MPRYTPATFEAQPVELDGDVLGYVVSGFLTRKQLEALREIVDADDYERTKRWRGGYQEMAKAMVGAIDDTLRGQPKVD